MLAYQQKVSTYLIWKQATIKYKKAINSIKVEDNIIENIESGTKLCKKDSIEWYITKYYEKLYGKEKFDENLQKWFLQFVNVRVTNSIKEILDKDVDSNEIFNAIKH